MLPRRLTNEDYINRCKANGLDLPIEPYINMRTKIKFKCKYGHIYEQTPSKHLLDERQCPICYKDKTYLTFDSIYNRCIKSGYDLPIKGQEYSNNRCKLKFACSNNHIYLQSVAKHLRGQGCPKCKGGVKYSSNDYKKICKEKEYDLPIEKYINTYDKIKHKCNNCGNIYLQTPNMHLQGQGCPICNESKGERYIRNYLNSKGILYETQKTFMDLVDKGRLSYDFYLPDYNILIEYQGKQHYSSIDYFGGEEKLKVQQEHDKLKRDYAKDNGYKLLELHYSLDTQDKVDKYLKRRIK